MKSVHWFNKCLLLVVIFSFLPSIALALQATVTWVDQSNNETGFAVQRRDGVDANPWIVQTNTAADVTSFNQTGLLLGTRYCYRIVAFNALGSAVPSTEACGTPDVPLPASGISIVFAP